VGAGEKGVESERVPHLIREIWGVWGESGRVDGRVLGRDCSEGQGRRTISAASFLKRQVRDGGEDDERTIKGDRGGRKVMARREAGGGACRSVNSAKGEEDLCPEDLRI